MKLMRRQWNVSIGDFPCFVRVVETTSCSSSASKTLHDVILKSLKIDRSTIRNGSLPSQELWIGCSFE